MAEQIPLLLKGPWVWTKYPYQPYKLDNFPNRYGFQCEKCDTFHTAGQPGEFYVSSPYLGVTRSCDRDWTQAHVDNLVDRHFRVLKQSHDQGHDSLYV